MAVSMVAINERQSEALGELLNVALGLTAAKLTDITGQRVVLGQPVVANQTTEALGHELAELASGDVISVQQSFAGTFSGDAILLLNSDGALRLTNLFAEEHLPSDEILNEVGNMLLSACLGVFSNLIQTNVSFSVPVLRRQSLSEFQASLVAGGEVKHAVVVRPSFQILQQEIASRIVVVLGTSSITQLIEAVNQWEGNPLSTR